MFFISRSGVCMISTALRTFGKNIQFGTLAFRVPTLVGLFHAEDPTEVGTLYTATVACAVRSSLLRPLVLRLVLVDIFQLVIAVLDDGVHEVALIDDLRYMQDRRNILLAVVDSIFRLNLFTVSEFDCRINRAVGERLNRLVDGHGLLAFRYSLHGVERGILSGHQNLANQLWRQC